MCKYMQSTVVWAIPFSCLSSNYLDVHQGECPVSPHTSWGEGVERLAPVRQHKGTQPLVLEATSSPILNCWHQIVRGNFLKKKGFGDKALNLYFITHSEITTHPSWTQPAMWVNYCYFHSILMVAKMLTMIWYHLGAHSNWCICLTPKGGLEGTVVSTHCDCPATVNLMYTMVNGSIQLKNI